MKGSKENTPWQSGKSRSWGCGGHGFPLQPVSTTSEHNQCAQPVCTSSWDPGKQPALTSNVKTSPMVCRADVLRPKQARHSGARHRIWGPLKGHSPSHYGIMALTFLLFSFVFHCPPFRFAHKVLASCISCFTELFISMEVTGPTASPIQYNDIHNSNIKTASIL